LIDHDPRYDSVESSVIREELFRDYCRKLEAEDEEEMARKEDERRQRDRKTRYDLIAFQFTFFQLKFVNLEIFH